MIKDSEIKETIFDMLVMSRCSEVINWLCGRYERLRRVDAEDIVMMGAYEMWTKFQSMDYSKSTSLTGLFKTVCRNIYTHWLRDKGNSLTDVCENNTFTDSLVNEEQYETDYGIITASKVSAVRREMLYQAIDHLSPSDKELIMMRLESKTLSDIRMKLKLKTNACVKVKQHRVVAKLRSELTSGQASACPLFVYRPILWLKNIKSNENVA